MRRHTIVGCHKSFNINIPDSKSLPASRPDSRQKINETPPPTQIDPSSSEFVQANTNATSTTTMGLPTTNDTDWKTSLDELQWKETLNSNEKLSLTLEEIVHIRSVMTKAELEGLPVGIKIKEEVERRKLCFLCLRTRFTLFGQRGVNCKLCDRTVCIKCFTKVS